MEEVINFIKEYWKIILAVLVSLITTIISTIVIIKKSGGKLSLLEALKLAIVQNIPGWAAVVECPGSGEEKKNAVVNLALRLAAKMLNRKLTDEERDLVKSFTVENLELVLAAPHKKESREERKSIYRV